MHEVALPYREKLLKAEIDSDCMEDVPRVRLYADSCLASDGNVEASLGLGAQTMCIARVLSCNGMNAH